MPFPPQLTEIAFTHIVLDTVHGTRVLCTGPAVAIDGSSGLELGCAGFAPSRSVSPAGDAFTLAMRIFPVEAEPSGAWIAKGRDQYQLFQPDAHTLSFALRADSPALLSQPLPSNWYGAWHTIVASYDGTALRLSIDGVEGPAVEASGRIRYSPGALFVGINPFTGASVRGFAGGLQIYDRAIDPGELTPLPHAPIAGCAANISFAQVAPRAPDDGDDGVPIAPRRGALPRALPDTENVPPIEIKESDGTGHFRGRDFCLAIDLPSATITSWEWNGNPLIELGPLHQLWRPPSSGPASNDTATAAAEAWAAAGNFENFLGVTAMDAHQNEPGRVDLNFKALIVRRDSEVLFEVERRITVLGHGEIAFWQRLIPVYTAVSPPRVGLEFRIPKTLDTTVTAGDGNHEDSQTAIALRGHDGNGLLIWSDNPFHASSTPCSVFQLSEVLHPATFAPDTANTLVIDPPAGDNGALNFEISLRMRGINAVE